MSGGKIVQKTFQWSKNALTASLTYLGNTMDVQRMDIQRLPSFEVMIVTST